MSEAGTEVEKRKTTYILRDEWGDPVKTTLKLGKLEMHKLSSKISTRVERKGELSSSIILTKTLSPNTVISIDHLGDTPNYYRVLPEKEITSHQAQFDDMIPAKKLTDKEVKMFLKIKPKPDFTLDSLPLTNKTKENLGIS